MTRKSCAVGMRNAILRNYLKATFRCPHDTIIRSKYNIQQITRILMFKFKFLVSRGEVKSFAFIESLWIFRHGLCSRIRNISYRKQSHLPEHFLRMWNILDVIVLDGCWLWQWLIEMPTRVTNIAGITPATFKFVNYCLFVEQRGLDFFMLEIFSNFSRNEDWT